MMHQFRNLAYCPETGVFLWKVARNGGARAGSIAGSLDPNGYRQIKVAGRMYFAHRLAWLFVNGEWPSGELDHINRDTDDNRIANLRIATRSQNGANRIVSKRSASGLKGVHFERATGKWIAHIALNGKRRKIGRFPTAQDAHAAYCKAAKEQWGEYARAR